MAQIRHIAISSDHPGKAADFYQRALKNDAGHPGAALNTARLLRGQDKLLEAEKVLARARSAPPPRTIQKAWPIAWAEEAQAVEMV